MLKHYVEFLYPGSFVSESSSEEIESRDRFLITIPDSAYGYRFFDREEVTVDGELLTGKAKNHSGYFYKGEIFDIERVKNEVPNNHILLSNMRINKWNKVIKCSQGFIPLNDNDVVIGQ